MQFKYGIEKNFNNSPVLSFQKYSLNTVFKMYFW